MYEVQVVKAKTRVNNPNYCGHFNGPDLWTIWGNRNTKKWTDASYIWGVSFFLCLHLVPDISSIGYSPHKYMLNNHLTPNHHHHLWHEDTRPTAVLPSTVVTTSDLTSTPPLQMRTPVELRPMPFMRSLTILSSLPEEDTILLTLEPSTEGPILTVGTWFNWPVFLFCCWDVLLIPWP